MKHCIRSVLAGALPVVLAACGGGGGSIAPNSNLLSAPGEAAIAAYAQSSRQASLRATDSSNNAYTLQLSLALNSGTTTFNGTPNAHSTVETITVDKNGVLVATSTAVSYFLLDPWVPLGTVYGNGSPYAVVTNYFPPPANFQVGGSGTLETITVYHDATESVIDAMITNSYAVTANDVSTIMVCIDTEVSGVTAQGSSDGLANGTESDCYTDDAAGNLALSSITLSVNGTSIEFK